jgi:hypothetical protein
MLLSMNDDEDDPKLKDDLKKIIDSFYMGPDVSQEAMTFQPGDMVRIVRATGAVNPLAWEGLLCRVVKSYHATSIDSDEEMEICVLVPLEPRPDNHQSGEEEWFTWRADLLARA